MSAVISGTAVSSSSSSSAQGNLLNIGSKQSGNRSKDSTSNTTYHVGRHRRSKSTHQRSISLTNSANLANVTNVADNTKAKRRDSKHSTREKKGGAEAAMFD